MLLKLWAESCRVWDSINKKTIFFLFNLIKFNSFPLNFTKDIFNLGQANIDLNPEKLKMP